MGKIVAISGFDRSWTPVGATDIEREIIRLSGKSRPRLLFVPTASRDDESYCDQVRQWGTGLGCQVDVLYLFANKPSKKEIEEGVFSSDIIFVGGGHTPKMLFYWRKYGVDEALEEAYRRGIVLSGVSAGAVCWFKYCASGVGQTATNPDAGLIKARGLSFINATCCAHYHTEKDDRVTGVKELMKKTSGVAIALDNSCAIEVVDDEYRIITSKSNANAYKVYYKKGEFHEEAIEKHKEFSPLESLLAK